MACAQAPQQSVQRSRQELKEMVDTRRPATSILTRTDPHTMLLLLTPDMGILKHTHPVMRQPTQGE